MPGSASIGRHYTVDASTPEGEYRVYVRVVPYDAATGASLWPSDTNQWNNSTRVPGTIVVDSAVCQ